MKKYTSVLLLFFAVTVYGQQEIQFTQFMQNRLFYNPGASGAGNSICITGVHRSQWVGFQDAPTTQNLNASVPLDILHGGVGVNFTMDQIGNFTDVTAGLSYAYKMQAFGGNLGLGILVDFRNKSINSGEWLLPDGSTGGIGVPGQGTSNMNIDLNFGAYYEGNNIWAGISSTRLIEASADFTGTAGPALFKNKRTYIIMAGYDYALNPDIVLKPAVLVKTDITKTSADIHLGATYNNKIWGGVSYRLADALGLMAGYYITPDFKITYAYDITLSNLRTASGGSHEILLGYCFNIEIPEKVPGYYRSPRFL